MATRAKKVLAGITALAALAFGGAAIAQAGGSSQAQQTPTPAADQPAEQGGESTAAENSATDPDNVQDETGSDKGEQAEAPGSEQADGPEGSEQAEAPGSEVPGDDGPGGHADETGNPNADHQFQGKE